MILKVFMLSVVFFSIAKEGSNKGKTFEKVQVTGSLIRRTDFEGPSPIEVIDRSSLEESSFNSVGDMLREMPISSSGSVRESSGGSTSGVSTVNLRGLGGSNTLVLLNGQRLQIDGVLGSVDVSLIPEIAIERAEILKDGASATYGSDAIGGVVSFQTRKDFTGSEASVRYSLMEEKGGNRLDVAAIGGRQFGSKASVTASVQYRKNERIQSRDREFTRPDERLIIGWSDYGPTPNYKGDDGKYTFVESACSTEARIKASGRYCAYPFADRATSVPEIEQISGYVNANFKFNSRTEIDFTGIATQKQNHWVYAPTVGGPSAGFEVPAAQASTINNGSRLPGVASDRVISYTYRAEALGDRVTDTTNDSQVVNLSFQHDFLDTWQLKLLTGYSQSQRFVSHPSGYALLTPLQQAVKNGSFNPFSTNPNAGALGLAKYQPWQRTKSHNIVSDVNVNGELFELFRNIVVSGAFGAQYLHLEYSDTADEKSLKGEVFGGANTEGAGYRDVLAFYSELGISFNKFEIQANARYDSYSDFGDSFSPKLAVKYNPVDNFMVRASYGKAFKAPLMTQLYASGSQGFPSFVDHVACDKAKSSGNETDINRSCRSDQHVLVKSSPNRNLDAEKATSYGVGLVYEPFKRMAIVFDYWHIDQTNLIGLSIEEMTRAESKGADPNKIEGVKVVRNSDGTFKEPIEVKDLNLQSRVKNGFDLGVSYVLPVGAFGKLGISNNFSYIFTSKQEGFPGAGKREFIGTFGMPKWRNSLGVDYQIGRTKNIVSVALHSTDGQLNIAENGKISDYHELDFSYSTVLPWIKGSSIRLGIKNILGTVPPYDKDGGATPFNSALYSPFNRYAFISYRQKF